MSTQVVLERAGVWLSMLALFLLPWQTRYIVWRPYVGTSEGEFGVISIYGTMILAACAAFSFLFARHIPVIPGQAPNLIRYWIPVIGGVLLILFCATFPSSTHAWILNVLSTLALGYAAYELGTRKKHLPLIALGAGLVPSLALGIGQMLLGESPASTLLGLAARNAEQLGDAVIMVGGERMLRMYGTFPHPNIFGVALALVGGAFLSVRMNHKIQHTFGMLIALVLPIIAYAISRSAALALFCALIAYGAKAYTQKVLIAVVLFLPALVWSLQLFAPQLLAIRGQAPSEMRSAEERIAQIHEWKEVMVERGASGTGFFEYPNTLAHIQGNTLPAWTYQPMHNVFLLIVAEGGILLVGAGVVIVGMILANEHRRERIKVVLYTGMPFFVTVWSLAWFDHALWTSWSGMAYTAAAFGMGISTLDR